MMAEMVRGLRPEEVEQVTEIFRSLLHGASPPEGRDLGDLEALQGVSRFPVRVKCALLPWMTLREALKAWRAGRSAPPTATSTEEGTTA
jgi:nitrogen fixation NifU-like protein